MRSQNLTSRRWRMRNELGLWLGLALVFAAVAGFSVTAHADETYTVALFTPSLDFADGVERNTFVTNVARELAETTEVGWRGKAFARRADFESALRSGDLDLVIVDGEYFAARSGKLSAVASLESTGGRASHPLEIVARSGVGRALHELRGTKLVVPDVTSSNRVTRFVRGDILGAELDADEFFGSIQAVKDVRSAINAVELGKADAALVYAGYGGDLADVYKSSSAPMPVVAVASSRLRGDLLERTRKAARSLSTSGAGLVRGSTSFGSSAIASYRAAAARQRDLPRPSVNEPPPLELDPGAIPDLALDRSRLGLVPASSGEPFVRPALDALDPEL